MSAYKVGFDERRGFLTCCVTGEMEASQVDSLCSELIAAVAAARSRGPVRLYWDNRGQRLLLDDLEDQLVAVARDHLQPEDRVAVLVSNSLDKAQGRRKKTDQISFFLSDNAAYTWLNAGVAEAA